MMAGLFNEKSIPLTTMPEVRSGFESFYAISNKVDSWEFHCHDFYEIYIHVNGGQYFGLDDNMYLLEPNQFFIIPPFCMHGLSSAGELLGYERAYLNVSLETLKVLGCGQLDLDRFFRSYTARGQNRFQFNHEEARECLGYIKAMQVMQNASSAMERYQNYAMAQRFISRICSIIASTEALTSTVVSNTIMQKVLTYVNSNYTQPLKISDLAKQFNVSVSYLSHEFVKYTNRSVYDYVLYRRVMLAKELISTDISLNNIAYQCGFNDYSNFLRMFHKVVGISPNQYRKQMQLLANGDI